MKKLTIILGVVALVLGLVACAPAGGETPPAEEGEAETPTPAEGLITPLVEQPTSEAVSIEVQPTPTPKPPPPTPTPLPPSPTPEEVEEEVEEEITLGGGPMVEIPAGPFVMGNDNSDPNEAPAHQVDLPPFFIDQFEVTNADFTAFVEDTGYMTYAELQEDIPSWRDEFAEGEENHPVLRVTFNDAAAFCDWAGKRLPTEEEWEKAARGPDGFLFPWGNDWDPSKANVKESGFRSTIAVGSFAEGASPYGVFDMAGNVWEWTDSPFVAYPDSTYEDPKYSPDLRVTRGGGYFDIEAQVLATNRNAGPPDTTASDEIGFRCAK